MDDGRIKRDNEERSAQYSALCDCVLSAVLDGRVRSRMDIRSVFGASRETARSIARRLIERSLIYELRPGIGKRHLLMPLDSGRLAVAAEAKRVAEAEREAKWRAAVLAKRESDEECEDFAFTHRLIAAVDAPPLPKLGPASVWDLAA